MASARKDGRGGWTPGKRRNTDCGDWQRIRIAIAALLTEHGSRGTVSARGLARSLGVSDRTVRRWLAGEDRPPVDAQSVCRQWLTERRAELRAARRAK